MIWWVLGIWCTVGFITSFIWHAYVIVRGSEELDEKVREIESKCNHERVAGVKSEDRLPPFEKGLLVQHHRLKIQSKVNRKPGWLILLAPWLIFTSRLD